MKKWERTAVLSEWTEKTTVFENGDYYRRLVTYGDVVFNEYKTTVFAMGWTSVDEFLKVKTAFKRVGDSPLEIRIIYEDGTTETTRINATKKAARTYYVGKVFNVGTVSDVMKKCVNIEIL